jgi:flagellar protein FlaE
LVLKRGVYLLAFLDMFKRTVKVGALGVPSNVNQSALNLIMDQIKDLIEINTSLNKKYRDLESKLSSVNADVGSDKKSVTDLQKKIGELQSNMEKFIGLYEVITNQFNPFVDTGEEADNYEIDANGNPVSFKRPSYGAGSAVSGRIGGGSMPIPSMDGGGALQALPSYGQVPMADFEKKEFGQQSNPSDIDNKTGDILTTEKESARTENVIKTQEVPFSYETQFPQGQQTIGTGVLDKLDVNAIVPLTNISGNVNSITTVLSWMVYLSKQCGENATDVLNYYTSIGWMSHNVSKVLTSYLSGIHVKPEDDSDGKMDVSDHIVSLFFIAKIKGVNVNAKTYKLISKIVKSKGFIIDEE